MSDGRWVRVGFSSGRRPSVAITEHRDVRRLPGGFLTLGNYVWPRVWIQGFDMERVMAALGSAPLLFTEANGIRAELQHGGPEGWLGPRRLEALEVALGPGGLSLGYALGGSAERFGRRVLLPWELLILRYPVLAPRREEVTPAPAPADSHSPESGASYVPGT